MKRMYLRPLLFLPVVLIVLQSISTPGLQAATVTHDLSDLIGNYSVSAIEQDRGQSYQLGSTFQSIGSFTVELWGNIDSFPVIADNQGHTRAGDITGGIHFEMLPFPATGYGWGFGVVLPNELGEFYRKFSFNNSAYLQIPSSNAQLDIGFYFTGYQSGETFFQEGALDLTNVRVTLDGTPVPEPTTIWLIGAGVGVLLGFHRKLRSAFNNMRIPGTVFGDHRDHRTGRIYSGDTILVLIDGKSKNI